MNIADLIIIIIIAFGAVIGFKRGLSRSLLSACGLIACLVLAFILKNPISVFFYDNMPFFKFAGVLKGVTVLNIALYELIAFILIFSILTIILKLLMTFTSIFEKILSATIILGIPSKILGAIVGAIQYFLIAFVLIFIISMPIFNLNILNGSKFADKVLNKTPFISNIMGNSLNVINEFSSIKDKYEDNNNSAEDFNKEVLELFLKYDVVKVSSIDKLIEKNKLSINNAESILAPYREEK